MEPRDPLPPVSRATRRGIVVAASVVIVLLLVYFFIGSSPYSTPHRAATNTGPAAANEQPGPKSAQAPAPKQQIWTCSMHPQIRLPNPGKCPICYMDLIPLETDADDEASSSASRFTMSEAAKALAEVETSVVRREKAKVLVRMLGMVTEDETRVAALTSRVEGRLDKIYVDFTGVHVNKGDPMVTIWSPTLIKNQVELFETLRGGAADESVVKGAEEKLIQAGLTREQVDEIKEKRKPILYVTLKAPISGTVTKKMAVLGQFVKEGTEMYIVNDLSHVWIKLDAYETDIPWIRYGQDVTFVAAAYPGKKFKGKVLFIDPVLDTRTRTIKIRVEAPNPDYELRPGMFVTAELESEIGKTGKVIKSEWTGKYICPVHPRDDASPTPGVCPDSGMEMRPASSYGYAEGEDTEPPLVIPVTAPLITGKRAVVYVAAPESDKPTYELREVTLGPRAGDQYIVYDGLTEGERVVTRGAFKIDSAMQILGKPSMMHQTNGRKGEAGPKKAEEVVKRLEASPRFIESLTPLIAEYLAIKDGLVEEDGEAIKKSAARFLELLPNVPSSELAGPSLDAWNALSAQIRRGLEDVTSAGDIQQQRKAFDPLSEALVKLLMTFRHKRTGPLLVYFCPMAFAGQGAYWIDAREEILNPYYGRKPFDGQDMLRCGELVERIPPDPDSGSVPPAQDTSRGKIHTGEHGDHPADTGGSK
ncbi:MAG: efflux RND transporter periplasmic adaptor subunit [Desulfomonilaceae bacterium]